MVRINFAWKKLRHLAIEAINPSLRFLEHRIG
jgi:hypothetical protein